MNGVFDLGGTAGLGPITDWTPEEPTFHAKWEKAVATMFLACFRGGWFGLDSFRHASS